MEFLQWEAIHEHATVITFITAGICSGIAMMTRSMVLGACLIFALVFGWFMIPHSAWIAGVAAYVLANLFRDFF